MTGLAGTPVKHTKPLRKPLSLSVFFPCYNEEENVERTTEAALRACNRARGWYRPSDEASGEAGGRRAGRGFTQVGGGAEVPEPHGGGQSPVRGARTATADLPPRMA